MNRFTDLKVEDEMKIDGDHTYTVTCLSGLYIIHYVTRVVQNYQSCRHCCTLCFVSNSISKLMIKSKCLIILKTLNSEFVLCLVANTTMCYLNRISVELRHHLIHTGHLLIEM